jgi:hypothetical protein
MGVFSVISVNNKKYRMFSNSIGHGSEIMFIMIKYACHLFCPRKIPFHFSFTHLSFIQGHIYDIITAQDMILCPEGCEQLKKLNDLMKESLPLKNSKKTIP